MKHGIEAMSCPVGGFRDMRFKTKSSKEVAYLVCVGTVLVFDMEIKITEN